MSVALGAFSALFLYRPIPDTPRCADKNVAKTASQIASTSLRALMEIWVQAVQNMRMQGQIALITGARGNMGRALVQRFASDGFHVIGVDAHAGEGTPQVESHAVDLMNEDETDAFLQSLIKKCERIDVCVLTVGGFAMGSIAETKTSDITQQYKLNFETMYNVARPVFVQMLKQGDGRLFLVGARPALSAAVSKGMVAYGLAKSLVFRVAEMMNDEAKGTNVSVHVIVPSIIDTPQNRVAMPEADFTQWVTPEQIAQVVSFYAGASASALRESVIKLYGRA
jgi:NAD(P)-dependent dehydrogenase (short-subunit alcohol dehydrogenase family)